MNNPSWLNYAWHIFVENGLEFTTLCIVAIHIFVNTWTKQKDRKLLNDIHEKLNDMWEEVYWGSNNDKMNG